jgi:hypothetical protein
MRAAGLEYHSIGRPGVLPEADARPLRAVR